MAASTHQTKAQSYADDLVNALMLADQVEQAAASGGGAVKRLREAVARQREAAAELADVVGRIEALGVSIVKGATTTATEAMAAVESAPLEEQVATERVKKLVSTATGGDSDQGGIAGLLAKSLELSALAQQFQAAAERQTTAVEDVAAAASELVEVVAGLNTVDGQDQLLAQLRALSLDDSALDEFLVEV
jgi:hypothetical protein